MKLPHIIALLVIALAIGIIVSSTGNASTYVDFAAAETMRTEGNDDKVHVVGKLKKVNDQFVMMYNPLVDPNHFEFVLVDNKNKECSVIYKNAKPQDFEKSEQVVVVGNMQAANTFVAKEILMKCPSKYEENKLNQASR